jgi:hypothetical protein
MLISTLRSRRVVCAVCATAGVFAAHASGATADTSNGNPQQPAIAVADNGFGIAAFVNIGRTGVFAARVTPHGGSPKLGSVRRVAAGTAPSATVLASGTALLTWAGERRGVWLATLRPGATRLSTPRRLVTGRDPRIIATGRSSALLAWRADRRHIRFARWTVRRGLSASRAIAADGVFAVASRNGSVLLVAVRGARTYATLYDSAHDPRVLRLGPAPSAAPQVSASLGAAGEAAAAVGGCCTQAAPLLATRTKTGQPLTLAALPGVRVNAVPVALTPAPRTVVLLATSGVVQQTTVNAGERNAPAAQLVNAGTGGVDALVAAATSDGGVVAAWRTRNGHDDIDPSDTIYAARMPAGAASFGVAVKAASAHVDSIAIAAVGAQALVVAKNLDPPPSLLVPQLQ